MAIIWLMFAILDGIFFVEPTKITPNLLIGGRRTKTRKRREPVPSKGWYKGV